MQMSVNNEKEVLLQKISAIGLSVYDTMLYLDIHDCPEAREYLKARNDEYDSLIDIYESRYGKLTHKGHPKDDVVWPWQIEKTCGRYN